MKSYKKNFNHLQNIDELKEYILSLYNDGIKTRIIFNRLINTSGDTSEALDYFFDLLKQNGERICYTKKYAKNNTISYDTALKIVDNLHGGGNSTFKFGVWLLSSTKMNYGEKQVILGKLQTKLQHLTVDTDLAQRSFNDGMLFMRNNIITLSCYSGANVNTLVRTTFDLHNSLTPPLGTVRCDFYSAYLSPICMALYEKKPLIVRTLLSCGYKITDYDQKELSYDRDFRNTVVQNLSNLKLASKRVEFIMTLLGSALDCDTPILEAVHTSAPIVKAIEIVNAIAENKQKLGVEVSL